MYQKSMLSLVSQSRTYIPFTSTSSSFSFSSTASDSSDIRYSSEDLDEHLKRSTFDVACVFVPNECDAFNWVINRKSYCFDVNHFADRLIKATYIEAHKYLRPKPKRITVFDIVGPIIDIIIESIIPSESISNDSPDLWFKGISSCSMSSDDNIEWPKISEFNIKLGLDKLEDYISTWEGLQHWMFCIEFIGFECEDSSNVFVYEVEWSKPTNSYPIPQVTASVYFALEVFKMVPYKNDRNIDVTYIFEGSGIVHEPGRIDFQEKWLEDILEAKTKFYQKFTFSTLPASFECDNKKTNLRRRISEIFEIY